MDIFLEGAINETMEAYASLRKARRLMRSYAAAYGLELGELDKHLTDLCNAADAMHSAMIKGAREVGEAA